jgi:type II secretion system protein N
MARRKLLVGAGYGAFSMAALFVGFYLTFPADAVGQRLAHEVQQKSDGAVTVSFDEISPYRLSGVAAEEVKIRTQKEGQQPLELRFDEVRVRLRLLPLLLLRTSFDAQLTLGEGEAEATITPLRDGELSAALELDEVNLASPPIVPTLVGLAIGGTVTGSLSADLRKDPKATGGRGKISITGASLGPGTIQGFTLPGIELGNLELELAIEQGRAKVSSFRQQGGQVQAKLSGSGTMKPDLKQSAIDLCLELKPDPAFLEKNPKLKAALQIAEIQLKKNSEGFLNVPLVGTLAHPRFRPGLCRAQAHE